MRVGDDHGSRFARHFGIALELAGVAAVDLVENQVGSAAFKVRVAQHIAAELGTLQLVGGVVEDQPLAAHVELAKAVVRQAVAVGGGNVDQRHAVAGIAERGVATGAVIDGDLCGGRHQRIEGHDNDQQTGDGAVDRAVGVHGDVLALRLSQGRKIRKTHRGGNTAGAPDARWRRGAPASARSSRWRPHTGHGQTIRWHYR